MSDNTQPIEFRLQRQNKSSVNHHIVVVLPVGQHAHHLAFSVHVKLAYRIP